MSTAPTGKAPVDVTARGWQPIETAPQQGVVDLFVPWMPNRAGFKGFRFTDCYRRDDGRWTSKTFNSEARRTIDNPSHWMQLPDPPPDGAELPEAQNKGGSLVGCAPSVEAAYAMGTKGGPAVEAERLAFEAWLAGHCWALGATWNGKEYLSDGEHNGRPDPQAMRTRQLWAAWRDRAALGTFPG